MKLKWVLRSISAVMLIGAILFLSFALTHPEFGSAIIIGDFKIGADAWRVGYAIYAVVTIAIFVISLFVDKNIEQNG